MAADELVALLDRIFSAFDRLADAERVEKIKTISALCKQQVAGAWGWAFRGCRAPRSHLESRPCVLILKSPAKGV
jgi:hypothetical protein